MKAAWNGVILAQSDDTVVVEGNHYFPLSSMNSEYFKPSETHTVCPWKGTASYYTVQTAAGTNPDAAWFYPKAGAEQVAGRVAFWKGVQVTEDEQGNVA